MVVACVTVAIVGMEERIRETVRILELLEFGDWLDIAGNGGKG